MIDTFRRLTARVLAFFTPHRLDRDLDEELAAHVAMLTEDYVRRGMTPAEARRAAAVRVGNAAVLKEQQRDVRGLPGVETVLQDLRFAFRLIARDRWFSAIVVATLAIGLGANATGFTIVHAAFFQSLPFDEGDRLYALSWLNNLGRRTGAAHLELEDWRARSRTFAGLAGYSNGTMNISDDRHAPQEARGTSLTVNTFGVLRQPPLLGRDFTPADARRGADPVVILGYGLWKSRYGADRGVLGRVLRVNGQPATIIGVMPEGMKFPLEAEIWRPFIPADAQLTRTVRPLIVFGRLSDGVDRREAQAEANGIAQQLIAGYPTETRTLTGVRVETFRERYIGGGGRPMFMIVMGAVVFVLLIACANVANLLLSRSVSRGREMAVRSAMGATRARIVRQLLIESLVLAFIGGGLGLLFAIGGVRAFATAMQNSLPYWVVFKVDYAVIGYVAAICVLTAVLFGLAPALHVAKTNANAGLKEGGRGTAGGRRERRFSGTLVVTELALTIILLIGAGAMVRSFVTLYYVDLGIDIERLMAMDLRLPATKYPTPEARRAFVAQLEPRLTALAGVEAAALTTGVPPLDGGERLLELDGRPLPGARSTWVGTVTISPSFFDVAGVGLLRGRRFTDTDGAPGAEAVIVNERFAAQFFPGEDPIGRRLRFTTRDPAPGAAADVWRTIVGVSPLIKQGSPDDGYVNAVVYLPYREQSPAAVSLLVRSALPPGAVMDAVRREVQAIDADQPVLAIQTLAQLLAQERWWQRTWSGLFGVLAAIALVLSSVGLYAVMAYAVTQRTHEIGVRMALGAQRRQVSWLILERGMKQIGIGLALGFAASVALQRVLPGGREGISAHDPAALAVIALLLTAVSIAACLLPARRATRVDPLVALRTD